MLKQELEEALDVQLSEKDYEIIKTVYTYYPYISRVRGKLQVLDLYRAFGMAIFHDMYLRALFIQKKKEQMEKLKESALQVRRDINSLIDGEMTGFLNAGVPF